MRKRKRKEGGIVGRKKEWERGKEGAKEAGRQIRKTYKLGRKKKIF